MRSIKPFETCLDLLIKVVVVPLSLAIWVFLLIRWAWCRRRMVEWNS